MTYWNDGSNLGNCESSGEKAVSYNEDGNLLCEECLIDYHNNQSEPEQF